MLYQLSNQLEEIAFLGWGAFQIIRNLFYRQVRYRGTLTYVKAQSDRFTSNTSSLYGIQEVWGQLVDGGTTVLVCPGDHYSLSELPHAHVTGGILATALLFNYRMLFPEFPRPVRTFHQRRAVEKFCSGVKVFLHSKKGNLLRQRRSGNGFCSTSIKSLVSFERGLN